MYITYRVCVDKERLTACIFAQIAYITDTQVIKT